ncbi:MAG: prolipoprotein diacylglyceryl transferase [Opitutae bacterium]|nr:prolipoprotein diacylglyceryl transferase [Opitutae bacterium]
MNSLNKYWVHDLSPFLWKFPEDWGNWGPGGIRWYGISYLLGFISAYFLLMKYQKREKSPYNSSQILDLMTFQILGVLLGGRIGYVILYQSELLFQDPLIILKVWEGGMASHGGFLGVAIATLWYAKHSKQAVLPIADLIVTIVPPGLFFGRIANFINGELWGKTTHVSWGVLFPKAPDFVLEIARHPSQLYAACLEGLLTFVFIQWRFWKTDFASRLPGRISGEFLVLYAVCRIVNEIFREPDASLIMNMSRGQFYSIFLVLGGIILIFNSMKKVKPNNQSDG